MKAYKEYKKAYLIHNTTSNKFKVCKVLNEYDTLEEANKDIIELLTKNKSEYDLLKEFSEKDII